MEARCGLQGRATSCLGEHLASSFEGHPGSDTHGKFYKKQGGGLGAETHVFLPKYYHHSPRDTQRFGSQSVRHLLPVPLAASDSGARPPKQ